MLCRWIPAAFPTPTRRQGRQKNESRSCVLCSLILMERDGCPEWEWKFRKLCKIPSTKTLYLEKQSLSSAFIFFPFGKPRVCCESWWTCSPMYHIVSYRQLSHSSSAFFVCIFHEQEGVCHHCQWLYLAQPLWKYPCAVSSLDRFFSVSLNVYLNVSDPVPALKCCYDATAISHPTTETGTLSSPQVL